MCWRLGYQTPWQSFCDASDIDYMWSGFLVDFSNIWEISQSSRSPTQEHHLPTTTVYNSFSLDLMSFKLIWILLYFLIFTRPMEKDDRCVGVIPHKCQYRTIKMLHMSPKDIWTRKTKQILHFCTIFEVNSPSLTNVTDFSTKPAVLFQTIAL